MGFYRSLKYQALISRQGLLLVLLSLLISLVCAVLSSKGRTAGLDWLFYDNIQSISMFPVQDDIIIIDIDDSSLSSIGRWPWPRSIHAELIDQLSQAKAIFFDVLFPALDPHNPNADHMFAAAMKRNGNVFLPVYFETLGYEGMVVETPPHPLFFESTLAVGHVHIAAEDDGVVRSVYLKEGVGEAFWPHISIVLATQLGERKNHLILTDQNNAKAPTLGLVQEQQYLVPMPAKVQGLRHVSYSDVLFGKIDADTFRDKLVMVGATAAGLGDLITTPIGQMHGVELNAWIYHAYKQAKLIKTPSSTYRFMVTFTVVLLLLLVLGRLSPFSFLVFTVLGSVAVLFASVFLLLALNIWLPPISAVIGVVVFFPLWSWFRAESILRFLRAEIANLSASATQNSLKGRDESSAASARSFLVKIGLYDDKKKKQTKAGNQAVLTLLEEKSSEEVSGFWNHVLVEKKNAVSSNNVRAQGIELVARSISQLALIKESDQKNRQLIEKSLSSLQDAVCIADLLGEIIFVNHRFERWFNPPCFLDKNRIDESSGQESVFLLSLLDRLSLKSGQSWAKALSKIYLSGEVFSDEASMIATEIESGVAKEKQYLCQVKLVSVSNRYRDTLVFTFTDITQLKAAENARAEALSFLSHDLRAPMVSVLAILSRHKEAHDAENQNIAPTDLDAIEALVKKNLDYAESFLQLSKADAMVVQDFNPCDLHAVLDGVYVNALALASAKSTEVKVSRCDEDAWVLGDLALLERAVGNLVSNAIKYSPEASSITISLNADGEYLSIAVSDQGPGISAEEQIRLFDRYTRLEKTKQQPGAGLGLNFVATVARSHRGSVEVDSQLGKGATFTLRLPALSEKDLLD